MSPLQQWQLRLQRYSAALQLTVTTDVQLGFTHGVLVGGGLFGLVCWFVVFVGCLVVCIGLFVCFFAWVSLFVGGVVSSLLGLFVCWVCLLVLCWDFFVGCCFLVCFSRVFRSLWLFCFLRVLWARFVVLLGLRKFCAVQLVSSSERSLKHSRMKAR